MWQVILIPVLVIIEKEKKNPVKNFTFLGLSVGNEKPDFNYFLTSLVNKLKLLELGQTFTINNSSKFIQGFVLFGSFDKQAKADFFNIKSSIAYYGCVKCYQAGGTVKNKKGLYFTIL